MTPLAVAHRGDPYHFRENTLASVRSALLKGADAVEVDVRLTRDGVPVLLHDATLDRLWRDPRPVAALTAAQVGRLTGGGVPTLAAALDELRGHAAGRVFLDLGDEVSVAPTLDAVDAAEVADRTYYCGDLGAMLTVRAHRPDAEVAMTWTTSRRPPASLLAALAPRWLNLPFPLATPPIVAWAHAEGLLVSAWTPDWQRSMRRMLGAGVDSVTTNRLDTFLRLRGRV